MSESVEFLLNDEVTETDASDGMLVLDYLRKNERLVGTKEGCKEGDCGACAVLIGEMNGSENVEYDLVPSCMVPLGEMQGKHLVTIEGMNVGDGLNPVQQAMVDTGGTQCGFCTPGFIVSMVWYVMCAEDEEPNLDGFQRAISGNLCRCTGYTSINRASEILIDKFSEDGEWESIWNAENRIETLAEEDMIPEYFVDVTDQLADLSEPETPDEDIDIAEFFVAGGTDIYVQDGEELPKSTVAILNHFPQMKGIRHVDGEFRAGALTTFEAFGQDPDIREFFPTVDDAMFKIASLHIRNRATLGGNIINASPIADMTNLLLALETDLVLEDQENRRVVPMEEFYHGYKQMDRNEDELLTEVVFPDGDAGTKINFEKVSKRKALDIATVCSGARLRVAEGELVEANITLGGVAPYPLLLEDTRDYLLGQPVETDTVYDAIEVAREEISPISDVRGSDDYKRLLARQLIIAHFTEAFPEDVRPEAVAS
jgi:xanthine dehydrogenase small subunit